MRKPKRNKVEDFLALSNEQKERIAAEFDREFVADDAKPLITGQRRLWEKAKKRPARRRTDDNEEKIVIRLDRQLLKRADTYARRQNKTREELIAEALESRLGRAG